MSGLLALILVGCGVVAAWCSAMRLSLQDPSRSELEHRLRRRNGTADESEETHRVEWIFARRSRLVTEFAFLRIICSVAVDRTDGDRFRVSGQFQSRGRRDGNGGGGATGKGQAAEQERGDYIFHHIVIFAPNLNVEPYSSYCSNRLRVSKF